MQSQMIGMQSSLDRILNAIQYVTTLLPRHWLCSTPVLAPLDGPSRSRVFPPLPGFAPPVRSEDALEPQ